MPVPLLRAEGLTVELLTIHHIGEAAPRHIITACDDADTCPSCGAGYKVGLSACEYCRQAVECVADGSLSPSIHGDGSGQALPEIA